MPDPTLSTTQSDTPGSYGLKLKVPDEEAPEDAPAADPPLGTLHDSNLRRVQLKLPEGTAISPSAANGLEPCTDAQLGKGNNNAPACPAASDVGDVTVVSKNLDHVLHGDMYVGQPTPQDTYRLFLAFPIVDGLWIKVKGVAKPDPVTGQVSTDFLDLPALPFTDVTIEAKKPDGTPLLVNPAALRQPHDRIRLDTLEVPAGLPTVLGQDADGNVQHRRLRRSEAVRADRIPVHRSGPGGSEHEAEHGPDRPRP